MPLYLINASRPVLYEVEVEADTPEQAIELFENMDNLDQFADYSEPIEIDEMEELGE